MLPERTTKGRIARMRANRASKKRLVQWEGFFYDTVNGPQAPNQGDHAAMHGVVLDANQYPIFDQRGRRFGNLAGLESLVSQVEQLQHTRDQQVPYYLRSRISPSEQTNIVIASTGRSLATSSARKPCEQDTASKSRGSTSAARISRKTHIPRSYENP